MMTCAAGGACRSPPHTAVFKLVLSVIRTEPDIKVAAGKLNLSYERQEPDAIKIFRKMVTDCLTGVQVSLRCFVCESDGWARVRVRVRATRQKMALEQCATANLWRRACSPRYGRLS
jgi:nicotinamide mononucleotide adenylyltransferase